MPKYSAPQVRDHHSSDEEMAIVGACLASGEKMFISGSEIGWDLDERGDETARAWLRDVLRVGYVSDDAETCDPDWPDVLEATGGSGCRVGR